MYNLFAHFSTIIYWKLDQLFKVRRIEKIGGPSGVIMRKLNEVSDKTTNILYTNK